MEHQIHPNRIRQLLFLIALFFLGIIITKEMFFMLGAFLGAITLYVIMRNWMLKLVVDYKWKKWLAALTLIISSVIILVIPLAWITSVAINKITPIIQNPTQITAILEQIHQYLISKFNIDILNAENIKKINGQVVPYIQTILGGTLNGIGNVFFMYLMLYFMLVEIVSLESWLRNHLPFKQVNSNKFISEFRNLVYSNALGIPIVAFIQGLTGLIGYWIFGVQEFVLMGLLTAICSVIPMVGSMIVYVPLAIYMLSMGQTWQGVAVALWGFIAVGSVDNIARFMLQKRMSNVHPLITLFGVFIGINLFGFLGIIFGPLLLSMFLMLVRIYIDEFGKADADRIESR